MNGRKYYVHIVEKGQTVYSITKAYRVESYDAITHVDIHSLHPGDTVWIPFRGQFTESEEREASMAAVFAAVQMGGKHNVALLDGCIKAGSPLAQEIQRLRGQVNEDDDDSTRNELRDQK